MTSNLLRLLRSVCRSMTAIVVPLLLCTGAALGDKYDRTAVEGLVDKIYPEARVDLVAFSKIETSSYGCRDGSPNCSTYSGSMIEERWNQRLQPLFAARDFFDSHIDASFFRSVRTAWSARYANRICTDTSTYQQMAVNSRQRPGSRTVECTEDGSAPTHQDYELTSPPTLHTTQEKGSFSGRWLASSNIIQDYSINLSSRMELTFNGPPMKTYRVSLNVSATRIDLDKKSNLFKYTPVPCPSIVVAGQKADSSCNVRLTLPAGTDPSLPNIQVMDVTPSVASAPYISYDISLLGVPEEK